MKEWNNLHWMKIKRLQSRTKKISVTRFNFICRRCFVCKLIWYWKTRTETVRTKLSNLHLLQALKIETFLPMGNNKRGNCCFQSSFVSPYFPVPGFPICSLYPYAVANWVNTTFTFKGLQDGNIVTRTTKKFLWAYVIMDIVDTPVLHGLDWKMAWKNSSLAEVVGSQEKNG